MLLTGSLIVNTSLAIIIGCAFGFGLLCLLRQKLALGCFLLSLAVTIFVSWHYILQAAVYIAFLSLE